LPYFVVRSLAFSAMKPRMARRSLRSSSSSFCSSAMRKAMLSTPSCVSLRSSRRASRSGPISEIVARTGWPCSPKTSQNTVVNWSGSYFTPISSARLRKGGLESPGAAMPERSPLMSAAKTGTPSRAKPSASTCSVTVLPVPVAPVTRPWRLASLSRRVSGFQLLPIRIAPSSAMGLPVVLSMGHGQGCSEWRSSAEARPVAGLSHPPNR